jgi:hypothetical protein
MSQAQNVTVTFNLGQQRLIVNKVGTGTGTVTSSPAGIDCGATCTFDFDSGIAVTLTASPSGSSTFSGWGGGGCSGTSPTCVVTMDQARIVTATFDVQPDQTLTLTKTAFGRVVSSPVGIECDIACTSASSNFPFGTVVTLTAISTFPFGNFSGWGGACSGNVPTCTVTMDQAQNVTATFGP